jgi:membrane protease subunit HflK
VEPERRELDLASSAGRLATAGLAVQSALALVALATAVASHSFTALGVAAHLGAGALAWAAGLILVARRASRLAEDAEDERLAKVAASEGRRPLFERRGAAALALSETRIASGLGALLALAEASLATALVVAGRSRGDTPLAHVLAGAAVLVSSAFVLLLLAKFAIALVRREPGSARSLELVAAGARRAASGALAALAGGVLLAAANLAPSLGLDAAGYAFAALEGLLAAELLLALVLELYRPRRRGELPHPGYESRLLALLAEPSDVARSLARAVDYQFGFQLSETWVYGAVERGIAPIVIFVGIAFWTLSAFVVVPQGDVATLERFGARRGPEPLEPGLHAKAPWPIDSAEVVSRGRVRTVFLGAPDDEDDGAAPRQRVELWTRVHAKDEYLVLVARSASAEDANAASLVDLLAAGVAVRFVVSEPLEWSRQAVAPEALLKALGERELARLGCSRSVDALIGPERGDAARELKTEIQASADVHRLGVRILDVELEDMHPPVDVASAFHLEMGALEEKEARRLAGLGDAALARPSGEGEASAIRARAETASAQRVRMARASARAFEASLALDRAAPHVFRDLARLRAVEEAFAAGGRRVVVPGRVQAEVDLSEKITEGLLEGQAAETEKAPK